MTDEEGFNSLPDGWERERRRLIMEQEQAKTYINAALEKERAEKLYQQNQCGATIGASQMSAKPLEDPCHRASLRERVLMDLAKARRESRKLERLSELEYLLDKNPDIARILDLIEDVRALRG